ncbi:MAG: polysaccharide biosynthesis/export family protein [Burkholderiaceae bacterium]
MISRFLVLSQRLAAVALAGVVSACGSLHFPLDVPKPGPATAAAPTPPNKSAAWGDAPALPVAAAPAASAVVVSAKPIGYVIGPEDGLDISVWKDDTLKTTALVRPDGGISFPLVGELMAAGKTADQLRDELKKRLEKYIPDAVVTVAVVHVASYRIYVLGRVNKPGDFAVGRDVDVLQALALAGGLTPFAHEDDIRVVRKIDGRTTTIPFRYSAVFKDGDLTQNVTLRSGDVLLVP